MPTVVVGALFFIARALFTEKVIRILTIYLLEWLAKRTTNELDDRMVRDVKIALLPLDEKPKA